MTKLLFILPSEDCQHRALFDRLVEEALKNGIEVGVLSADADAVIETSASAQAVIGDVVATGDLMRKVKAARPGVALIGVRVCDHKTTIAKGLDDSYSSLLRHRCTIMLCLLPGETASPDRTLLITGERGIKPSIGLDETARSFIHLLQSRVGKRHHRTELTLSGLPETVEGDLTEVVQNTKEWAKLSLFPKYESHDPQYPGAEFGFVAKRTEAGTLITARASAKENPGAEDFALITGVGEDGSVHVRSSGRKASLNAPLAHRILGERPDINYVVHSHIFLPKGITVPDSSTPGTLDDWEAVASAVRGGARVVNQPHHGTLILLEDPQELLPLLMENSLYKHDSHLYDLAYARFQATPEKPTSLERVIRDMDVPAHSRVLDLCCGTGASTIALQALGLEDVDFADGSPSMLAVAEMRLGRKGKVVELQNMGIFPEWEYDLVTVRQAFAYVQPRDLDKVAQNIARILKPTGRFVFNGFAQMAAGTMKSRDFEFEQDNVIVRTREDNQITDEAVLHTQRSEIVDFNTGRWDAILDVNHFHQHAPARLREAFANVGLSLCVHQQGNSICYVAARVDPRDAEGAVGLGGPGE